MLQAASTEESFPDSKVHGANIGPTWVLSAPDGPHVVPTNLAIRVSYVMTSPLLCVVPGTEMTFRGYGITCVVILILYTALTYAFRAQSPLGPPPEDRHEILEESSHLAPCGVPMSPMSRALSSERIDKDRK